MTDDQLLLLGLLVAAVISAVGVLLARNARHQSNRRGSALFSAAGLGIAYLAGHTTVTGFPELPPLESTHWVPYLALAAALVALAEAAWLRKREVPRWMLRAALLALTLTLVLRPIAATTWGSGQAATWLAAIAALSIAFWVELDFVLPNVGSVASWLTLALVAGATATAVGLSGSLVLGQVAGMLAATAAGPLALCLFLRPRAVHRTAIVIPAVVLTTALLCGYFYAELSLTSALLLAVSPLGARLVPRSMEEWNPRLAAVAQGAAVLLPAGAAVFVAYMSSPPIHLYS